MSLLQLCYFCCQTFLLIFQVRHKLIKYSKSPFRNQFISYLIQQFDINITYMTTSLIFNTIHTGSSQKYTYLLNLISQHPSFKSKVNEYYEILSCSPTPQSMIKLGTLYFAFLLPEFPDKQLKYLAQELFENIKTHDTQVTYNNLREYLLKMCSYTVENIDVRSAIGFLELLKSRITDTYIVSAINPKQRRKINIDVKIEILEGEAVLTDSGLPQKHHREEVKHIYFEQKVALVQEEVGNVKPTEVVITELKSKTEDVIPWGYICEDFIYNFTNGNFELKSSYRLRKSKRLNIGKIDYWATSNETTNNLIRDFTVNQDIFITTGIITHNYLPPEIYPPMAKPLPMARINQNFARKNYLQNLKDTVSGTQKFFNIMSQFFERNQFNIDELSLTREKLIVRRKENLLGIAGKESIKKQQKDFEAEVANMGLQISKNIMKFYDEQRVQSVIKQLSTNLRQVQQQDKNLNTVIEKNLSYQDHIQRDSNNPFFDDIIKYAKMVPLQLLILGRPKSGKSTLAKAIAKKYSLVYISVESMIDKVFERNKFFEENPPQADEDGNVKDGLTAIEKYILSELQKGSAIDEEEILDLINNELQKEFTQSRGFILDLPFEYNKYWIQTLIGNRIYLPKIECRSFTHIIQTEQTQEQWKHFTSSLMEKPEDQTITSGYDRYLLKKPKPPPEEGEQQAEQDDAQKPQPLVESNLLQVKWKDSNFSLIEHFTQHIHPHKFIKVQNSFQSVQECLNLLENSLYKIPLPKKIEGNEKELLSVGLEQQKIFRKWSPWGLIDCVQLWKNKLLAGKFEFAAEYAGRVFVFENQQNLNAFLNLPRKYLTQLPKLPKNTNIFITGPRKSGKKTIANLLGSIYDLKVINIQQILEKVLLRQRQFQTHIPSNFDKRSSSIHLSEAEFRDFSKGGILNAKDVLPIILYQLGVTLQKKPVGWGVQKTEQGGNAESPQPQQRKAAPKKTKKKDKNVEDQRPKTPPPEDLALKDIIPEINHLGKLNQIRGYVIIGYPNNEEQLNALKAFNIPIDKLIILSDNSEETPNKNLQKRLSDAQLEQVSLFTTAIGPVKEALGEQVCKQILIDKTPEEIVNKIRQIIDPFYVKADEDSINRVCADKTEQGDPIPMGFCGDYCPVSLKNGWLIKGKDQFEAGIQGKRFKFAGQKQINQFKQDPSKFLSNTSPAIPPRIMFMGLRGVGLKTQLLKLNEKYRIPILSLKDTLLQQLENEKGKRKTERYYNKGFKKPQFDQEGKQLEDPQILEEAADFDRKANEIQVIKNIFNGISQIFINANFFDVEQEKVSTSIVQLLGEARKLPEMVFMLTSDEQKWLDRVLDKKAIQRQLQDLKEKKRIQKEKEKEEARKKAQQAGQQYNEPPEEEDPEIPKLEELIAQKAQALKAQRQADAAKLQQFTQAFKSWGVEVVNIKCERQIKHVTDRINYLVKPIIDDRINRWEKNSMLAIERHRVNDFLNNFIVSESRFGKLNPYTLMENPKPYPLIYRDRIYFLKDEEERDFVIRNPKTLQQNQAVPKDVRFVPIIFIIGKTKSGKSTLALNLREKYGFKIISLEEIIEQFVNEHEDSDIKAIMNEIRAGKVLSDQAVITLIEKRTSLYDCSKGWILDGLPLNKRQCQILNKRAIVPTIVLSVRMSELEIKKKVISKVKETKGLYDYDLQVIHKRLQTNKSSLIEVEIYYNSKYNNVKLVNGNLSKWGVLEQTKSDIQTKVKARRNFIRDLVTHSASDVTHIGLSSNCILHNISEYLNFCPISYKIRRQYVKVCIKNYQNIALFNRKIYAFKSEKQLKDFIANPDTFVTRGNAFAPPQEINIEDIYNLHQKFEDKGYCMIELSKKNLTRGNTLFGLSYKDKYFLTSTAKNQRLFQRNPALYEMVKLPDKLPVQFEKKSDLKKIAKRNDCSAFLEHHLSNIMMKCLAQLGYRRPKYPTLGSKESALKFLSISLKANNPNKDDQYRQKYSEKLNKFIKECNYSQQIREQLERKAKGPWESHDEQNLLKLCEEYSQFMKELQTVEKTQYFSNFIR